MNINDTKQKKFEKIMKKGYTYKNHLPQGCI